MLQKKYFTLADLNEYVEKQNIDKKELRIFICNNITELQKTDSKLPLYAEIDADNDLRIVIETDENNVWSNFGYSRTILRNLTNEEKLNALCRSREINKEAIASSIIDKIRQSDIEDKDIYVGEHEIWDRDYITYTLFDELYIDYYMKYADGLDIDLSEREKEFLMLATVMNVTEISVEAMR